MLEVDAIDAGYDGTPVVRGLSLSVAPGEVLAVMGRNGAGKSTALKAIMGLVRPSAGAIRLDGATISGLPAYMAARLGVGYVPQGRRLFAELTVAENLKIALMTRASGAATREKALAMFPHLRERLDQVSGTLSGGEQQMLAVARALCLEPRVLLLDEPTEGLQPSMITLIRAAVAALKAAGVATILVEQRVEAALAVADRVAFVVNGATVETVDAHGMTPAALQFQRYIGV